MKFKVNGGLLAYIREIFYGLRDMKSINQGK